MKTIIHFLIKELLQFKRDKKMFVVVLVAPILQLIFLGYAANMDLNVVHTAVFDQSGTSTSRNFVKHFEKSGYFIIDSYVSDYKKMTDLINKGKVLVALVIPHDFEKKIYSGQTTQLQTIFEGSDGNKASIALGYIQGIVARYSEKIILDTKNKFGIKLSPAGSIIPEVRVWYNPEMKTRNFMMPGIMGLLLMITTISLMSMAVVREREIGTLEQLIVTPLKPYQLLIGKLIPFTLIGFIVLVIVMVIMTLWFGIAVRGSIVYLLFASLLFVLSNLGLGLFISTVSKTQQQAMMASIFAAMMPMIYLSGFAFPIENMPQTVQYITYLIPLRYYIIILRGIVLKGIGFSELWFETLILLIIGISILFLSARRFRKRLE